MAFVMPTPQSAMPLQGGSADGQTRSACATSEGMGELPQSPQQGLEQHSTLVSGQSSTWSGRVPESDGLPKPDTYIFQLDDSDIQEIELRTLPKFKELGLNGDEANKDNFNLPIHIRNKLERAAIEVHQGCGVAILRCHDPNQHSPEDNLTLLLALSDHVGDVRGVQNRKGDMITHITDARQWSAPYSMRHGIHTNEHLPFHNDMGTDILALQVRQCAKEGGHTYVASAGNIFCELAARRPDVIETLARADWPIQVSASPPRFVNVPLLQWHHNRVLMSLDPGRLGLNPAIPRHFGREVVPPLTAAQREAIALVSSVATEHRLCLDTRPGDIVFINNWALLHARDKYKDCDEPDDVEANGRRHLVRLWLRNSRLGWDIPASMRIPWEAAFGPDGMGDKTFENTWRKSEYRGSGLFTRYYPVVPASEYKVPKYTSGSAAFLMEDDSDAELND
ncbi:taurine catabolism dioxygenase family protein [Coniochaeta sp. 2T2.1]|nr:taurine catabolism dioxygenase family protein [Coniochaeta sp. 2T2.1]